MSPEQVRGEPADSRSDIFALGLVLYELLTGERAFQRETGAEIMTAILREDPPDLVGKVSDLSPAIDRLVRHCLEKRPAERFQSARDLAFDLEALSGFSMSGITSAAAVPKDRGRGRWVLAKAIGGIRLMLYPTGAGPSRIYEPEEFEQFDTAWLLDDERALVRDRETGKDMAGYLLDLASGEFRRLTDYGVMVGPPSSDGQWFPVGIDGERLLVSLDGESLYLFDWTERTTPMSLYLHNVATGERRLFRQFPPVDRSGAGIITSFRINPAGTSFAFSYPRIFSELHRVEGLR